MSVQRKCSACGVFKEANPELPNCQWTKNQLGKSGAKGKCTACFGYQGEIKPTATIKKKKKFPTAAEAKERKAQSERDKALHEAKVEAGTGESSRDPYDHDRPFDKWADLSDDSE